MLRRCAGNMGVEHVEAWCWTGCGVCQQNKDGGKKKVGFQRKKNTLLVGRTGLTLQGALWCFTRAQAFQITDLISLVQLIPPSPPQILVTYHCPDKIFLHSFSFCNMWPGILHPIAVLLILNVQLLAVSENIFPHPGSYATTRSLIFQFS